MKRLIAAMAALGLIAGAGVATAGTQETQERPFRAFDDAGVVTTPPDDSHGPVAGHLPARRENMRLLSRLDLAGGPSEITDVDAHRGYAYLGTDYARCVEDGGPGNGVFVVDVRDPRNPRQVAFIATQARNGEGIHAFSVRTPQFTGDLLLISNETCGEVQHGGITIVDVTNPRQPEVLASEVGDTDANDPEDLTPLAEPNDVHSVMGWSAGRKAYAVMTDNFEAGFLDVDIMDITDPSNPVLISETGIGDDAFFNAISPQIAYGDNPNHHDMWVKKIDGTWYIMASYWDAGWVLLDVNDPTNPVVVDDHDYAAVDPLAPGFTPEGNAHQGSWSKDNEFWVGTDEDFSPHRIRTLEILTGANAGQFEAVAVGGGASPALLPDGTLNGPVVYGGYGCPPEDYPGATPVPQRSAYDLDLARNEEAILVMQRGPSGDPSAPHDACFPGEKAAEAIEAGWDAVVLVNRHFGDPESDSAYCGSGAFPEQPPIVTVCTTHTAFHAMFNTPPSYEVPYDNSKEPQIGDVGERVSATAEFDGWGYAHLLDADTLETIDVYAPREVHDPRYAFDFGVLSAHEVETDKRRSKHLAYFSWYSAGARVVKFGRTGMRERGVFIHRDGNDFWGVETIKRGKRRPVLLLSDRDFGLYVLKYTGPQ
ncbi:MAG: LVIVD repeat-containing protein [Actinomycetota bacterium]